MDATFVGRVDFQVVSIGAVQAQKAESLRVFGVAFAIGALDAWIERSEEFAERLGLQHACGRQLAAPLENEQQCGPLNGVVVVG